MSVTVAVSYRSEWPWSLNNPLSAPYRRRTCGRTMAPHRKSAEIIKGVLKYHSQSRPNDRLPYRRWARSRRERRSASH
jgi:hypothetical protein